VVQLSAGRFAAAAALGGGGTVRDAKAFAELPFFVGVGTKDFALGQSRALNKALTAGGAKRVTFKEYEGIEHMVIVREALPDVFAVFDRVAK
jgi:alpha-beta hydrolase superfamily lysophospholipase